MNQQELSQMSKVLTQAVNEIFQKEGLTSKGRADGTSTYWIEGTIGNKKFCYTKQRTYYNGKKGFYSWIQTKYQNGKIKRTKFAKSGSKLKAEARAKRLVNQYESKLKIGVNNENTI